MFTSEMTNCRFWVLTSDMSKPMVAHVEGTGSFTKRDEVEVATKFLARRDDTEKRMRRLSVSGVKNPTRDDSTRLMRCLTLDFSDERFSDAATAPFSVAELSEPSNLAP